MKTRGNRISPTMKPLGLFGGGQLARMMALAAHDMGVPVAVLSASPDDPAAQVVSDWIRGDLSDRVLLDSFLAKCSVVTFESEFLDATLLAELSLGDERADIFPQPRLMGLLQDRLSQKALIAGAKLPTSPYFDVRDEASARQAWMDLGGHVVFKKRRYGYDGYGTWVVRTEKDFAKFAKALEEDLGWKERVGFLAERFIPFRRELAIMIVRSRNGDLVRLPFVETFQENSKCLWVKGPLKETARMRSLAKTAETFLAKVDYVGAMGFELFETKTGDLLVNELAPRVHNSGHYSLDALSVDQFELHVRAVLGLDLPNPAPMSKGFAMVNLLGKSTRTPSWRDAGELRLHWYGKKENRPGRKMGHVNVTDSTAERALKRALNGRKSFDV